MTTPLSGNREEGSTGGFRPFFNPATGEWITYTAIAQDNSGALVRFNWRSVPGGVITEHIHPHQEERTSQRERADVALAAEIQAVHSNNPRSASAAGPAARL